MKNNTSNKSVAAYYLTLIGGVLGIIVGFFLLLIIIGVWIIIANILMIVYAQRLMAQPIEHSRYGTYIIILSILAGVNLLALIGGIIAVTYKPSHIQAATQPYQPYAPNPQPMQYHSSICCPQCGSPLTGAAQFCSHCSKQLTS